MLLAIDIGNSNTVLAVFELSNLRASWRIGSLKENPNEIWSRIQASCARAGIDPEGITGAGISSVVPDLTRSVESACRDNLGVEPVTISSDLDLGFTVEYHDPASVGADRLCSAIAGYRKHGGPLIVVDFGTATTFDVIGKDGSFLGGVICLGLEASASELHRRAARLPKVDLVFPDSIIGRDTVSSMQAGLLHGTVESVEGIVRRIRKELHAEATVIATGGLSPLIVEHTDIIKATEPTLVLEGIQMIVERENSRAGKP